MKTKSLIALLLLATACTEDSPKNNNQNSVTNTVLSGTWRITYFFDTDEEETNDFTGYAFTFGATNILTSTNGSNTYAGTWSVTDSNSNDDSLSDLDFNISFASPPSFEELSDDWDILEVTDTKIRLVHVSGGNGSTDYLTFEKN